MKCRVVKIEKVGRDPFYVIQRILFGFWPVWYLKSGGYQSSLITFSKSVDAFNYIQELTRKSTPTKKTVIKNPPNPVESKMKRLLSD